MSADAKLKPIPIANGWLWIGLHDGPECICNSGVVGLAPGGWKHVHAESMADACREVERCMGQNLRWLVEGDGLIGYRW